MMYSLIMCFFGGSYLTLIAAVEAYKMVGYESSLKCITTLIEDFKKVVEANKKDDSVDADGFYLFICLFIQIFLCRSTKTVSFLLYTR